MLPLSVQYHTPDYNYLISIKTDQKAVIKVYDAFLRQVLKKEFTAQDLQLPKLTISRAAFPEILALLVNKNCLPAQYFQAPQKPNQRDCQREIGVLMTGTAPVLQVVTPPTAPSDALDAATLQTLREMSQKSKAIFEAAELREHESIKMVQHNPKALQSLIAGKNEEERALGIRLDIQKKPKLDSYYQTFYQKLTGICLACYNIKSGMVDNAQQTTSDYAAKALDFVGNSVPLLGTAAKIISGIISAKNMKDKNQAMAIMCRFFADLDVALQNIKTIARELTMQQEQMIETLKPHGKAKQILTNLKDWFTADESNNPIAVRAIEDCEKLLTAVVTEEIPAGASVDKILYYMLGETSKPQARSTSIEATIEITSSSAIVTEDNANRFQREQEEKTNYLIAQMQRDYEQRIQKAEDEAREARKAAHAAAKIAESASKNAKHAKDVLDLVHGPLHIVADKDGRAQLRGQDNAIPEEGNSVLQQLLRKNNEQDQRLNELGTEAASIKEQNESMRKQLEKTKKK